MSGTVTCSDLQIADTCMKTHVDTMTNISDHLLITDATNFRHKNTQICMINEDDTVCTQNMQTTYKIKYSKIYTFYFLNASISQWVFVRSNIIPRTTVSSKYSIFLLDSSKLCNNIYTLIVTFTYYCGYVPRWGSAMWKIHMSFESLQRAVCIFQLIMYEWFLYTHCHGNVQSHSIKILLSPMLLQDVMSFFPLLVS